LPEQLAAFGVNSPQEPPEFAKSISEWADRFYLGPLRIMGDYNFQANYVARPEAFFEVKVLSPSGAVTETRRYPDPESNILMRHRQKLLAMQFVQDRNVQLGGQRVGPKGDVPMVTYWREQKREEKKDASRPAVSGMEFVLETVPETEVKRPDPNKGEAPLTTLAESSHIILKSYHRFLAKDIGHASFEIERHFRWPVLSMYLVVPQPPDPSNFTERVGRIRGVP
jgi:hypothetical protein